MHVYNITMFIIQSKLRIHTCNYTSASDCCIYIPRCTCYKTMHVAEAYSKRNKVFITKQLLSRTLQYPRLFKYNYTAAITFAMLLLPIHLCEHADIPESPLLQL